MNPPGGRARFLRLVGCLVQMAKKEQPRPRKHVPQRMCVGCGQVQGKREMVRVVRAPEGRVEVDPTGKRNGRGAYIHRNRTCWEAALKRDGLAHALKVTLSELDCQTLKVYAASLPIEIQETRQDQAGASGAPPQV
jgi:uncharacterized protein